MKKGCSHKSMEQNKEACKYNQLIFFKDTKKINRKRIAFPWNLEHLYAKN